MSGMPLTPAEIAELQARDVPSDIRLAARMGPDYRTFHDDEQIMASLLEDGFIDEELYALVEQSRFGYKNYLPAHAAPDFVRTVSEVQNSAPILTMVSQTVGGHRVGDVAVPYRRQDIAGMDSRSIKELIKEQLVRGEISFAEGMDLIDQFAAKREQEGETDAEEADKLRTLARQWKRMMEEAME